MLVDWIVSGNSLQGCQDQQIGLYFALRPFLFIQRLLHYLQKTYILSQLELKLFIFAYPFDISPQLYQGLYFFLLLHFFLKERKYILLFNLLHRQAVGFLDDLSVLRLQNFRIAMTKVHMLAEAVAGSGKELGVGLEGGVVEFLLHDAQKIIFDEEEGSAFIDVAYKY